MISGIAQVKIVLISRGKFPDSSGRKPVIRDFSQPPIRPAGTVDLLNQFESNFYDSLRVLRASAGIFALPNTQNCSPATNNAAWKVSL